MLKRITLSALVLLSAWVASGLMLAQVPADRPFWRTVVMGTHGMVAAEHPLEALAALETLKAGGNAIDAAVAAFYMTTVVEHHQAGIGGDGFIVAYLADRDEVIFINGTGPAPTLATLETYREIGEIPSAGPLASDVPGAVGGFDVALRNYGTKTYADLLQPAIDAATNGHPLSYWAAGNHERTFEKVSKYPSSTKALLKDGKPFLAWNTPGGDNQPQAMLQAFLAVVEFGMNVQQAVEAATVTTSSFRASNYPQRAGNQLALPKILADQIGDNLRSRGHHLRVGDLQQPYRQTVSGAGAVKMVMIAPDTGVMFGGASPAKDDYVIGW